MIKKYLVLICIIYLSCVPSSAHTMHAILFCDTNDARVGAAMTKDHDNMMRELGNCAAFIDYSFVSYDYTGDNCNKSNLISALKDLKVKPNDIVVFFYGGHGTRAENDEKDPFPQMCLGSSIESEFVPLKYAAETLQKHKPALLLCVSNCCNMQFPGVTIKTLLSQAPGPTCLSETNKEAYKKLFTKSKGTAIITSSQMGEYSWCLSTEGGFFTCDFLDVLYLVGKDKVKPDWKSVMSNAKKKTSERSISIQEPPYKTAQTPYYTLNITEKTDEDKNVTKDERDSVTDDNTNDIVEEIDQLLSKINDLIDPQYTKDERLGLIPIISKKFFTEDAKVKTLGRNGMIIDYEPINSFLRRVALSQRIAKITIINRDDKDKHSSISVHEIHK